MAEDVVALKKFLEHLRHHLKGWQSKVDNDFGKVALLVGTITNVDTIEKSDKLYALTGDLGQKWNIFIEKAIFL